ncbi:aspartate kinase [Arenimonas maotaiensis]|uniref:aspartate kinase n=2 Tax=Arenimonas maotaiensis TaxID=1446479 RepID=A0A917CE39_9GAMM|nr:aspartate kinase [Arenimonas maotaiensis]
MGNRIASALNSLSMPPSASPSPWIVLKFGGTSVSQRHRWDTIGTLMRARAADEGGKVLVVVSALSGVTNLLQSGIDRADSPPYLAELLAQLRARHLDFAAELGLDGETVLAGRLAELQHLLHDPRRDTRVFHWQAELLAQGELLSSTLGVAYLASQGLPVAWLDARDWLTAVPLPNQSAWAARLSVSCDYAGDAAWRARFESNPPLLITQGFIARAADGGTAILGRGGSDTSAAYFGALLRARRVEIWTDVPGMFSANPRAVPDARLLSRLEYQEAQEIATTGAKVLHPRCIHPCRDMNVPLWIRDTGRPDMPGTCISRSAEPQTGVKAISTRSGIVLVSMESIGMWQQVGFLADLFACFKDHGLSVDMISTSETNVTVSLDPSDNLMNSNVLDALCADLAKVCRVKVITPCSAVTLVGRGMRSMLDRLTEIWAEFGRERVHMVSQSSNDLNLTFVVDEGVAHDLLPTLHALLIECGAMPVEQSAVFGPSWRAIAEPAVAEPVSWWQAAREALLQEAAAGTPAYVYHLPTLRRQARAFAGIDALERRFYAVKANAHPAVLTALAEEGFGFECVSLPELQHVRRTLSDLPAGRLLFTPSFASRAEYAGACDSADWLTLDSLYPLRHWPELFAGRRLVLRIDPGYGLGHHAHVKTGGPEAKFGLALDDVSAFVEAARVIGAEIAVLHAHVGSGVQDAGHWAQLFAQLAHVADGIGTVAAINVGGGLAVPYRDGEAEFDIAALAAALAEARRQWPQYALWMEPGRYLTAQAGVLLARVSQVVDKLGVRRIGLDAGMNALMRPALYQAKHRIVNLSRIGDADGPRVDVVGPICESTDVLARQVTLPADTAEGDVLLIDTAGAYGFVMANHYNLRDLPREVIFDV